jgi:hypothetical protein
VLSPEEVRRLLDAAPLLLSLTYGCCLRASEVVSLRVCDIDSAHMVIADCTFSLQRASQFGRPNRRCDTGDQGVDPGFAPSVRNSASRSDATSKFSPRAPMVTDAMRLATPRVRE